MPDASKTRKTLSWSWIEDFAIQVFSDGAVDPSDWSLLIADLARHRAQLVGVLVVTQGGAPTPIQRRELRRVLDQGAPFRTAVVANSPVVRIVLAAIGLFLEGDARPRMFAPNRIEDAFAYLKVPETLWPECQKAIAEMRRELGVESSPT